MQTLLVKKMQAVIYSNGSQECERMASLLESLGGDFLEYRLDKHFSQRAFENEFGEGATYPQVSLGYKHVGNMHDTLHFLQEKGMLV
jgi:glutaredoxin